jgi:tetratricopeptide (TPR) repeat protein
MQRNGYLVIQEQHVRSSQGPERPDLSSQGSFALQRALIDLHLYQRSHRSLEHGKVVMRRSTLMIGIFSLIGISGLIIFVICRFGSGFGSVDQGKITLPSGPAIGVFSVTPAAITSSPSVVASSEQVPPLSALALIAPQDNAPGQLGLIGHELIRQSLLMVARDDFGMPTWDLALGETPPANVRAYEFSIASRGHLHIRLHGTSPAKDIMAADFGYPATGAKTKARIANYFALIAELDRFEQVGMPALLKKEGAVAPTRTPTPSEPSRVAQLPGGIDENLQKMDIFCQLSALRALHDFVQAHGMSDEVCARLVRGYANASLLSQYLWDDSPQVFAARSLLYAERCVSNSHSAPWALRHRAYARVLVGFIDQGIADLDAADSQHSLIREPEATPWTMTLRQFGAFDHRSLAAESTQTISELAHVLGVVAAYCSREHETLLAEGYQALAQSQTCFNVMAILSKEGGVSNSQKIMAYWPTAMEQALVTNLEPLPGLPLGTTQELAKGAGLDHRKELVQSLRQNDGAAAGIPHWGAIAQIIADDTIQQAWWLVRTQVEKLGVEADMGDYQIAIYDHPYRNLVFAYTVNSEQEPERCRTMFKEVTFKDFRPNMNDLLSRMDPIDHAAVCSVWDPGIPRGDPVLLDQLVYLSFVDSAIDRKLETVRDISGKCPAIAIRVLEDGKVTDLEMSRYRDEFPEQGPVRAALGHLLMSQSKYKQAEGDLRVAVRLAPEMNTYTDLAECLKKQGDEAGWLSTLQAYLALDENSGLNHASVQVTIAEYYMKKGDYEAAWPFASAAADTWAGWAMETAARCAEGRNDLVNAALWWQRISQRYGDNGEYWLEFILRTGYQRDQVQVAADIVAHLINSESSSTTAEDQELAGFNSLMLGETTPAKEHLMHSFESSKSIFDGLMLALLDVDDKDFAGARAMLDRVIKGSVGTPSAEDAFVKFAALLKIACSDIQTRHLDAMQLRKMLDAYSTNDGEDVNLAYVMAHALEAEGQSEDSKYFYRHAVMSMSIQKYAHVFSCIRLRALGVDPWLVHKTNFIKANGGDLDHM